MNDDVLSREDLTTIGRLLDQGEVFGAYDLIRVKAVLYPDDVRLREFEARALLRLGALDAADALLEELASRGAPSEEVLGLLASRSKSRALDADDAAGREAGLREALVQYERAWEVSGGSWPGLNVATLSHVLGDEDRAQEVARAVARDAEKGLARGGPVDEEGWLLGSLAEALLLCGRSEEALDAYERLREWVRKRGAWAVIRSARRNADLLLSEDGGCTAFDIDRHRLAALLETPPVLLAVGHMVDAPDRSSPRFPPSLESGVYRALQEIVQETSASVGFSSLAGGTDILFQEVLAAAGIPRFVMSPFTPEILKREAVVRAENPAWGERFDRLWETADKRCVAARHRFGWEGLCYEFGNEMLTGLALMRGDDLGAGVVGIAVWDGRRGDGPGGTQGTVRLWEERGILDRVIVRRPQDLREWPHHLPRSALGDGAPSTPAVEESLGFSPGRAAVAALLFADATGFGALDEEQISLFIEHVLGAVADVEQNYREQVFEHDTWGDCVFLVIKDVEAAGNLALDLRDVMRERREKFRSVGLPEGMALRIAVHAGPVRFVRDPVTGACRVSGAQVTHAARMEPITPPGEVYATEAFAALSRVRCANGYRCRYVGQTALAKAYGPMPAYHVLRSIPPRGTAP